MTHSDRFLGALALLVGGFGLGLFLYARQPALAPLFQTFRPVWPEGVGRLSLAQAQELWEQGATFVDAREPEDYQRGHILRAVSVPSRPRPAEQTISLLAGIQPRFPLVLYCDSSDCGAARQFAEWIDQRKLSTVAVLEEGWQGWRRVGAPIRW